MYSQAAFAENSFRNKYFYVTICGSEEELVNLKQKLIYSVAGFLIGNFILASVIFGFKYYSENSQNNVSIDEALRRINSREIKEVHLKSKYAELVNQSDIEFVINNVSEPQRELLFKTVVEFNKENTRNSLKLSESPATSDPFEMLFRIMFILFFISPPLIVLMLFLIWCELKKRNRMK
jgi:ATP-dependent Zn protease